MKSSRDVALVIGAGPRQVFLLGTLVASVAASMDFDDNTIGDIRMAAEELAHLLVVDGPATTVECVVSVDSWVATVALSAIATPPDREGYRWRALGAITDSLGVSDGASIDKGRTEIRFSRRRVEGTPMVSEPHLPVDCLRRASARRRGVSSLAARDFSATGPASG